MNKYKKLRVRTKLLLFTLLSLFPIFGALHSSELARFIQPFTEPFSMYSAIEVNVSRYKHSKWAHKKNMVALVPYEGRKTSQLLNTLFLEFDFVFAHNLPKGQLASLSIPKNFQVEEMGPHHIFYINNDEAEEKLNLLFKYYFGKQHIPSLRKTHPKFITGDAFRNLAQHILDDCIPSFDPKAVKDKDIIFVKSVFIDDFFQQYHPHIDSHYILITHNDDNEVNEKYFTYLNHKKLIAWFALNVSIEHEKLFVIPIGLPNKYLLPSYNLIESIQLKPTHKTNLAYINFSPKNFPKERDFILNRFKDSSFCISRFDIPNHEYISDLNQTKFIFAPRGNGIDTYRAWEALYVGSIPIIKCAPPMQKLYEDLPVLLINDWNDISEEFLQEQYTIMTSKDYDLTKLSFEYWKSLIFSYTENGKNR